MHWITTLDPAWEEALLPALEKAHAKERDKRVHRRILDLMKNGHHIYERNGAHYIIVRSASAVAYKMLENGEQDWPENKLKRFVARIARQMG